MAADHSTIDYPDHTPLTTDRWPLTKKEAQQRKLHLVGHAVQDKEPLSQSPTPTVPLPPPPQTAASLSSSQMGWSAAETDMW